MHDDDESDLESMHAEVMKKSTRMTVEAGTHVVNLVVPISGKPFTDAARLQAELRGRSAVIRVFRKKWPGLFSWDLAEFSYAHVTGGVMVEVRVKP